MDPAGQPLTQVAPFSVKLVGLASLLVQVPWKPKDCDPPAGIVAL